MSQEKEESSTWIRIIKLFQMGMSLHGMRKGLFYLHQRQFGWNQWENVIHFWHDHRHTVTVTTFTVNDVDSVVQHIKLSSIDLIRGMWFNCVRSDSLAEILICSCLFRVWYFMIVMEQLMYFGSQYLYNWFVLIHWVVQNGWECI